MNPSDPKPQPFGQITTDMAEFEKSLAASTARVCSCFDSSSHVAPEQEVILAALDKERGSRLTKELLDDARETLNDATTKLHREATMIEAAGAEMLAQARLHEAHQKFDLARSLRVTANYLLGVESA